MVTLPSEYALQRVIRQTIYSLKRQYGGGIAIYKLNNATTDLRTGVRTIDKDVFNVRQAVVLPTRITRDVVQSISQISANKKFVYGASFDSGKRTFVIDSRDVPEGFQIGNDDWIVYKNRRYDVESIEEFEFKAGWVITGVEVFGRRPEQIFICRSDDLMAMTAEASTT
jgi:hypothetical protein